VKAKRCAQTAKGQAFQLQHAHAKVHSLEGPADMEGEKIVRLFSYGTLQQESVQVSTFGRLLEGTPDALVGYMISMVEITDPEVLRTSGARFHPIVRHSGDPADETPGMVFEITEAELAAADTYEVSDYVRVTAPLKSGTSAWVYVAAKA
jgi:hypothetical protein